jgi:hypothetical protein
MNELKHNIHEIITFIEVSELILISDNTFNRLTEVEVWKGDILSTYYDDEFL